MVLKLQDVIFVIYLNSQVDTGLMCSKTMETIRMSIHCK